MDPSADGEPIEVHRAQALRARASGDLDAALSLYEQLESADPACAEWPLSRAEVLHRLGDRTGEGAALVRSAELYADAGRAIEAVALCRIARSIDPAHTSPREHLMRLASECRDEEPAARDAADASALPCADAGLAPLEGVRLAALLPGRVRRPWADEAIRAIALDPEHDHPPAQAILEEEEDDGGSPVEIGALDLDDPAARALRETPLFGELDPLGLERLIDLARVVEIADGEILHRRGDVTLGLYAVAHGAMVPFVEGRAEDGGRPTRREWRALGAGGFFGETALLSRAPHRVSFAARGDTRLLLFEREAVAGWLAEDASRVCALLRLVRLRLLDRLIGSHPLLASLSGEPLGELARELRLLEVEDGATLVEQGRPARSIFAVVSGRLSVTRRDDQEREKAIAELESGELCGDRAALLGREADASVAACGRTWLLEWPIEAARARLGRAAG